MKQALSLVITQGLKDRKAFRHKMCNLCKVSLPHKLLHSNNSGPKQVCKFLPCCLPCFAFEHHVALISDNIRSTVRAEALRPRDS